MKIGRNDPCHCGSGQKYKKCCMAKDDAARSAELAAQAAEAAAKAAAVAAEEAEKEANTPATAAERAVAARAKEVGGSRMKSVVLPQTPPVRRRAV